MLSALPGTAITRVRIPGLANGASAIANLREPVLDLLMNIADVRLHSDNDEPASLVIDAHGNTVVRAGDIHAGDHHQVLNPDLHIATLCEPGAALAIELDVMNGRGYVSAAPDVADGAFAINARFTPVERATYRIDHARVGQDTNLDCLTLDVWTDGTINGVQAIAAAADILRGQIGLFAGSASEEVLGDKAPVPSVVDQSRHDMPLDVLRLSARPDNALHRAGFTTVSDVLGRPKSQLLLLRNFGDKAYEEVRLALISQGLPDLNNGPVTNHGWE